MTEKEKLEEAKRLYQTANADQKYLLESLFPELFLSADERIKMEIVRFINLHKNDAKKRDKWIAWLEKQGKQKPKWTEEDEHHWMMCLECVEECATQKKEDFLKTINWLKSIKQWRNNYDRETKASDSNT